MQFKSIFDIKDEVICLIVIQLILPYHLYLYKQVASLEAHKMRFLKIIIHLFCDNQKEQKKEHHQMAHILQISSQSQDLNLFQSFPVQDVTTKKAVQTSMLAILQRQLPSNYQISSKEQKNSYLFIFKSLHFSKYYEYIHQVHFDIAEQKIRVSFQVVHQEQPISIKTRALRMSMIKQFQKWNTEPFREACSIDMNSGQILIKKIWQFTLSYSWLKTQILYFIRNTLLNSQKTAEFIIENYSKFNPSQFINFYTLEQDETFLVKYLALSFAQLGISNSSLYDLVGVQASQKLKIEEYLNKKHHFNLDYTLSQNLFPCFQLSNPDAPITQLEMKLFSEGFRLPVPVMNNPNQNQFIFNWIKILHPQKIELRPAPMHSSRSQFHLVRINYKYLPQQMNDRQQFFLQKYVLVKSSQDKAKMKKIQHQKRILKLFSQSHSPYLIKYYETSQPCQINGALLMDFLYAQPTLETYLDNSQLSCSLSTKLKIFSQITNGLRLLKRGKIVHMDLSSSNIIIGKKMMPKIIDFGEAYAKQICDSDYRPGFTLPFCPPECFTSSEFTSKSDIFSWGIMTYKALFSRFPFEITQKLKKSYQQMRYLERFFFVPESLEYIERYRLMAYIFTLLYRCMSSQICCRPYSTWCRIILKRLMQIYL